MQERRLLPACLAIVFAACGGGSASTTDSPPAAGPGTLPPPAGGDGTIGHVFVILMENHDWADIKGSASAPYINGTILPLGARAESYMNPPGLHPSLPNYLWLE